MLKSCLRVLAGLSLMAVAATTSWATPSSIIFIPSVDVQAPDTNHLGFDGYFTFDNPGTGALTDLGYTRGFKGRFELGIDHIGSQDDPILFNAKWQVLAPKEKKPFALSLGAYNWGAHKNVLAGNLLYVIGAYTLPKTGRISLGYQHADQDRVGDDNDMLMLAFERQLSAKWWAAIDYASGDSAFGALTPGVAYTFAPNTSVIFGYDFYNNNDFDDTITVQVDINF
jgi:hypothetical protein